MKALPKIAFLILLASGSMMSRGAQVSWDPSASGGAGLGGTGNWDTNITTQWYDGVSADIAWTNANFDDALFTGASGTVTLAQNINAGTLYFTNLAGGIGMTIVGTPTLTFTNVDTGATTNTLASILAGSSKLTKNGDGTLILGGNNTFTSPVQINQGALQVTNKTSLATAGAITITNGGSLEYNWPALTTNEVKNALTVSGSGVNGEGAWFKTAGNTVVVSNTGAITLPSTNAVFGGNSGSSAYCYLQGGIQAAAGVDANLTFRGGALFRMDYNDTTSKGKVIDLHGGSITVIGPSQLSEQATGTKLAFSNLVLTAGGQYTGGGSTSLSGETNLGFVPAAFYASNITMNSGILLLSGAANSTVTLSANRGIYLASGGGQMGMNNSGQTLKVQGVISGTGSLVFQTDGGGSIFMLTGNNTYSGGTTIQAATVWVGNNSSSGTIGTGNVANGGTLIISRTGTYSYAGAISGAGGLTIGGSGTVTLSGANTYTGNTSLTNGILLVNNTTGSGLGAGTLSVGGAGFTPTLGGIGIISNATTLQAGSRLTPGNNNNIGTLSFSNNLTLNATSTNYFAVTSAGGASNSVIVGGLLSPNSSVIKVTTGTPLVPSTNTLFTYKTSSGAFNSTPVMDVTPVHPAAIVNNSAGQINLVVSNRPPAAQTMTVTRTPGLSLHIALADVATNWSDPDGDTVTLTGITLTSTNGAVLQTNSSSILYPANANASDQIGYSISDNYGGNSVGTINVISGSNATGTNSITAINTGNPTTVTAYGVIGYNYILERATNLAPAVWVDVFTNTVGSNGLINATDSFNDLGGTPPASAYYQFKWQP